MVNIVSSIYVLLIVFIFLYDFFPQKARVVLYKKYPLLKVSKNVKFNCVATIFKGGNTFFLLYKNDLNIIRFATKTALKVEFCEENLGQILLEKEIFGGDVTEKEYAINGIQLFVKWDKNGLHSTFNKNSSMHFRVLFKKMGDLIFRKSATKCGFYIFVENKKYCVFVKQKGVKLFADKNGFGFLFEPKGECNFDISFENNVLTPIQSKLKANILKSQFGVAFFDGIIPNFDMLFFCNQPLKKKHALGFLKNAKYQFPKVDNFGCSNITGFMFFAQNNFVKISLTEFGFSKFIKIAKRQNCIFVFDALTKFKLSFSFSCYVKYFNIFCFLGEIFVCVFCEDRACFSVCAFGYDLSILQKKLPIFIKKQSKNAIKHEKTSNIEQIFNLLNDLVLTGNIVLDKKIFQKLNVLVFSLKQQKAIANLILTFLKMGNKSELLKNQSICKLLLKCCDYKNVDELNYIFLQKIFPYVKNEKIRDKFVSVLQKSKPKKFKTFEGIFCYEFGLEIVKMQQKSLIALKPNCVEKQTLCAFLCNKNVTLDFMGNGCVVFNGQKFWGETTIIL